jgi:spore germination protein D
LHSVKWKAALTFLFVVCLSACAPPTETAEPDYQKTKDLVVDILQTEDGKKAIKDVMQEEDVRQEMILNEPNVRKTIEDTLLKPDNQQHWQQLMMDPEFAKKYAEHLEEEHKDLIKDLMKDPQYQTTMMEILKDPEMEQHFVELLKSSDAKQQTMEVMKEAIESPYFRLELLQLLEQVSQKEGQQDQQEQRIRHRLPLLRAHLRASATIASEPASVTGRRSASASGLAFATVTPDAPASKHPEQRLAT